MGRVKDSKPGVWEYLTGGGHDVANGRWQAFHHGVSAKIEKLYHDRMELQNKPAQEQIVKIGRGDCVIKFDTQFFERLSTHPKAICRHYQIEIPVTRNWNTA